MYVILYKLGQGTNQYRTNLNEIWNIVFGYRDTPLERSIASYIRRLQF